MWGRSYAALLFDTVSMYFIGININMFIEKYWYRYWYCNTFKTVIVLVLANTFVSKNPDWTISVAVSFEKVSEDLLLFMLNYIIQNVSMIDHFSVLD